MTHETQSATVGYRVWSVHKVIDFGLSHRQHYCRGLVCRGLPRPPLACFGVGVGVGFRVRVHGNILIAAVFVEDIKAAFGRLMG